MNPALTTQSGLCAAIATASSASHCARSEYTDGSTANVGMSASSARASPAISVRSDPTATTVAGYCGLAAASRSAWRLVPLPEINTTSLAGSRALASAVGEFTGSSYVPTHIQNVVGLLAQVHRTKCATTRPPVPQPPELVAGEPTDVGQHKRGESCEQGIRAQVRHPT